MNKPILTQKLNQLRQRIKRQVSEQNWHINANLETLSFFRKHSAMLGILKEKSVTLFGDFEHREPSIYQNDDGSDYIEACDLELLVQDLNDWLELLPMVSDEALSSIEPSSLKLWSQRLKPASNKDWKQEFFIAFSGVIERLAGADFFAQYFGSQCNECENSRGMTDHGVNLKLREHLPLSPSWPPQSSLPENHILDFVEFFALFVSKPTQFGCWGDSCPHDFDPVEGKRTYDLEINSLFDRFCVPFRISQGFLYRSNSVLIDELFIEGSVSDDRVLNEMVLRAVALYRDPRNDRRIEAADSIVKAWEYIKTTHGSNVKTSVERLLKDVVKTDSSRKVVNDVWQAGTRFIHLGIRHACTESAVINDPELAGYVFLVTYVTILFAITQIEATERITLSESNEILTTTHS